ncbi:MAG TPA: hypothetical protein VE954_12670 [Oligoflexus sp.]|uniref:hypothetical protein n=1 Tax=Oligoflexus sp. TaxID=1971216 RepID=UPI002D6479CD|nr:hypothetical protein [Oligoflexus sp.]HYX33961.1 hypothetical protein [Oligoflexus sp.]
MRSLLFAILCVSSRLYAGGIIGGGPPAVQDEKEMMMASIPDLGLEKILVSTEDYRRAKMRLSATDFAKIAIGDRAIGIKLMSGAITNISGDAQLYPEGVQ